MVIAALMSAALSLWTPMPLAAGDEEVDAMLENLHWLGHDSFRVDGSKTVYFDPFKLPTGSKKADIILVSHEHFDHFSPDDIKLIATSQTIIVCDRTVAKKLGAKGPYREVKAIAPGDSMDIDGIHVEAVAAYNTNKPFHPKSAGMLGYIITASGARLYHAGDTDIIPEMKGYRCDIALLPVSGTYVMTADEAAQAALAIKPKCAVPMHYGEVAGSDEDASRFQELLKGKIEVKVLKRER